jgi:hypothetical protein
LADKRCENGHFIDESWDICPYCPAQKDSAEIPMVRPSRFEAARATDYAQSASERRSSVAAVPVVPSPMAVASPPIPLDRTVTVSKLDSQPQPKRYVVGWLVGLSSSARGESFAVRMGRNILGRDHRSDIPINDDQASSHHADLVFRPDERRFILMDHNSTNGTYVNDSEIEPRRDLQKDDVIRIGAHRFLFLPLCQNGFYWDDEGVLK